jgi:UDP-glucose 6-dehydrogenase
MVSRWPRGRRRRSPTARRSVEESAALALAQRLGQAGHPLIAYDPIATDAARGVLGEHVDYASSVAECIERADALLIANPCPEFKALTRASLPRRSPPIVVLDCWRLLRHELAGCSWIDYHALGVGDIPVRSRES